MKNTATYDARYRVFEGLVWKQIRDKSSNQVRTPVLSWTHKSSTFMWALVEDQLAEEFK